MAGDDQQELAAEVAAAFLSENLPDTQFGAAKAGKGLWASNITMLNTNSWEVSHTINLEQNEAAFRLDYERVIDFHVRKLWTWVYTLKIRGTQIVLEIVFGSYDVNSLG